LRAPVIFAYKGVLMELLVATSEAQFVAILRNHLKYLRPDAELDLHQPLKPLGLDSMAAVDLLLDIEDAYGVTLPDKYLTEQTFSTSATLWSVISGLRQKEGGTDDNS
jgi:acyl carrier protein